MCPLVSCLVLHLPLPCFSQFRKQRFSLGHKAFTASSVPILSPNRPLFILQILFLRKPSLTPGGGQDLLLYTLETGFLSHRALRSECNCVLFLMIIPFMSASPRPPRDNRLPEYKYFAYFCSLLVP